MTRFWKHTLGALLAAVALTAGAAPAKAGFVIDFDDIVLNNSYSDIPANYAGFTWNFTLDIIDITNPGSPWGLTGPAHSGQNVILNNYSGIGVVTANTGTFTMDGLYIRSWYDSSVGYAGAIRGYNGSTLVFTSTFIETNTWQFVAGSSQQITRFEIDGGNYFLVDDISINGGLDPQAVPAPPAAVLFGIGMVGLAGFRRLRRRTEAVAVA